MTIDLNQIRVFLTNRLGGDIGDVAPIGMGAWSKAFTFKQQGRACVIRVGAHEEDFAKDRFAARYANPALPIPPIIELGEALGGYYAISERVFGGYIDDVDGAQMRALLPSLFATLDVMRMSDLSATTGYGGWGADGNAGASSWQDVLLAIGEDSPALRIHGWRARLEASPVGDTAFLTAYEHLKNLTSTAPEERHLIHSDLLHYNVLVEGNHITGVLDWGCGKYGDFLYDLAWFCFWQPWYPAWEGIDFRAEAARHYATIGLDVPHFDERLRCCQLHIALDGLAYQAYIADWENLQLTVRRMMEVVET